MEPVYPEFVPDPALSREEMEALQREIADAAVFSDHLPVAVDRLCSGALASWNEDDGTTPDSEPVVAGVDQAFDGDEAVSAIVVLSGGAVVERVSAAVTTEIPYIPGLLSFREGNSVLAAFEKLERTPDVVLFDGSGRIHYRQAGLATHVGVLLDVPAIGVIKNLLCGSPRSALDEPLPEGTRIPIDPDDDVERVGDGNRDSSASPIGYALQTRQFDGPDRYVNPVFVSPGHRVSAETATDVVEQCCAGYKLPEPIRLADAYAAELTAD